MMNCNIEKYQVQGVEFWCCKEQIIPQNIIQYKVMTTTKFNYN